MQYKTTLHAIISKFNLLQNILAAKYICITTELRILNSNVKFGAKTWITAKTTMQKIQTFYNTCLMLIFNIQWPERIINEELWEREREPYRHSNLTEEVGLDTIQHHLRYYILEFACQEKEDRSKKHMKARHGGRIKCTGHDLGRHSKSSPEPYSLKENFADGIRSGTTDLIK